MTVVSTQTWTVGQVLEAADFNSELRDQLNNLQAAKLDHKFGTYTGDGEVSQAITGVGFTSTYIRIWNAATDGGGVAIYETFAAYIDDDVDGLAIKISSADVTAQDNSIIAIGADGFTVDDSGGDGHPNKNTIVYYYMCLGIDG